MDGNVAADAAAFWDSRYRRVAAPPRDWLELPYVRDRYIDPAITGTDGTSWLTYAFDRWLRPAERLLEIGCGSTGVAFEACRLGVTRSAVGVDVSPEAIRNSKQRARTHRLERRLEYRCADVGALAFADGEFDAVVVNMALHHVLELELLLTNVRRWKRPDAPFVINEYVGPDRFQWTPAALREGQRLLESLDERYRMHAVSGQVVTRFEPPRYAGMVLGDASEAIRSSAIVPLLKTYFEVVELRPYGGTLLHVLLAETAHNFEPETRPEDARELDRLFDEERRLLRDGVLESNFAVLLVR